MNIVQLCQFKIKCLIEDEEKYNFPEFLQILRKSLMISRKTIQLSTGISQLRLYYLEKGNFKRKFNKTEINLLANFYQIPKSILIKKWNEYIDGANRDNNNGEPNC